MHIKFFLAIKVTFKEYQCLVAVRAPFKNYFLSITQICSSCYHACGILLSHGIMSFDSPIIKQLGLVAKLCYNLGLMNSPPFGLLGNSLPLISKYIFLWFYVMSCIQIIKFTTSNIFRFIIITIDKATSLLSLEAFCPNKQQCKILCST